MVAEELRHAQPITQQSQQMMDKKKEDCISAALFSDNSD